MPSGYARRLVRITESVVLPHHRSLLGTCPLARGLCLGAQRMIILCRRRLQTPRAAANGTGRPAALRYARARSDSAPGGTPHARAVCILHPRRHGAARSGLPGSILVHSGTCSQGKATMRVSDAASTTDHTAWGTHKT